MELVSSQEENDFLGDSVVKKKKKNPLASALDVGLIPGLGRSPGEGNGHPLQYSCLGNPIDREALQAVVHGHKRVRYHLATKPPSPTFQSIALI